MDMTKALFRPCIDLHDGKVKQIVGGTLNTAGGEENLRTNFVSENPLPIMLNFTVKTLFPAVM